MRGGEGGIKGILLFLAIPKITACILYPSYAHNSGVPNSVLQDRSICVLLLGKFSRSAVPALLRVRTLIVPALTFAWKGVAVPLDS